MLITIHLHVDFYLQGYKAIQWGTEMESTAVRLFQEHFQLTVQPTGLWLHNTGVIGASPDGLIPELNATVEVKCPYRVREKTIAEARATMTMEPSPCKTTIHTLIKFRVKCI